MRRRRDGEDLIERIINTSGGRDERLFSLANMDRDFDENDYERLS
jgi:hypothetical protein